MKKNIQMILKSLFLALFVLLQSGVMAQSNTFKLEVKEEKGDCTGVGPMKCYFVKYHNSKDWEYFYTQIQGFDYQEGYRYTLRVKRTKLTNVPADGSTYKYELVKILKKKAVKVPNKEALLGDKKWFITELNGKTVGTKNAYIKFFPGRSSYSASMGCNTLNGAYTQDGKAIHLKAGMSTQMMCDPETMKLESAFSGILNRKYTLESTDNGFTFKENGQVILKIKAQTTSEELAFLGKHKWKLFSLHGVGMDYGNVTLEFNANEKRVFGNSGCNNFNGPITIEGNKLIFGVLARTLMACPEPEKNETEQKLMALFSSKDLTFDIAEQTFNIYQGSRTVATYGIVGK